MGQLISSNKNSTINFVNSFQRLDSQLPVPYQDLGVIPEVVYDTDKPEEYSVVSASIDWAYQEQDMMNIVHSIDNTLIINTFLEDDVLTPLTPIIEQGLNKSSALTMGFGGFEEIDTKGLAISNLVNDTVIQKIILPDEEYPQRRTGVALDIPEPSFSYVIAASGTGLVPEDMTVSYTWLNMLLSARDDEMIQSDILSTENAATVDTSDVTLVELAIDPLEADEPVPGASTDAEQKEGTIILPPNIIIQ